MLQPANVAATCIVSVAAPQAVCGGISRRCQLGHFGLRRGSYVPAIVTYCHMVHAPDDSKPAAGGPEAGAKLPSK